MCMKFEIEKHLGDDGSSESDAAEKHEREIINILTNHNNNSLILAGCDSKATDIIYGTFIWSRKA